MSAFSFATVFFFTAFVSATLAPGTGACYGSGHPDTTGFEVDSCALGGDTNACYVGLPGMTGTWTLGSDDKCKDADGNSLGCCNGICGAPCPGAGVCYGSGGGNDGSESDSCTIETGTIGCYVGQPGMTGTWTLGSDSKCKDSDGNALGCCNGVCGEPCEETMEAPTGTGVCYGSGWGDQDGDEVYSCNIDSDTIGCYVGAPGMTSWTLGIPEMCQDADGTPLDCCDGVCGVSCDSGTPEAPPTGSGVCYGSGWGGEDGKESESCVIDSDTIGCYVGDPGMTSWTLGVQEMCQDADGHPLDCCNGVCGEPCPTEEPTNEPTAEPTNVPTLSPTSTVYSNLGWGKCLTSHGQDPSYEFYTGKSEYACKSLCNSKSNCGGYSRSYYSNCLLWMDNGLIGGGASWGGARCKRKLGLPGVVEYETLGSGKCLTSDGQDPNYEYYANTSWWKCQAKCNSYSSCGGFSRSNYNNCLIWRETGLIGGGASWGGAKCHRKI